jgi:hypothetical protein
MNIKEINYVFRLSLFICLSILITIATAFRSLLTMIKTNTIRQRINPSTTDLNTKQNILINSWLYCIGLVFITYTCNTINIVLFDSITKFPFGLLLTPLITLLVEKGSNLLVRILLE